jgi:hypothetical protein
MTATNDVAAVGRRRAHTPAYPLNQWYAAAFSGEVARTRIAGALPDRDAVLYHLTALDNR